MKIYELWGVVFYLVFLKDVDKCNWECKSLILLVIFYFKIVCKVFKYLIMYWWEFLYVFNYLKIFNLVL